MDGQFPPVQPPDDDEPLDEEDEEWEAQLLSDPRFLKRVAEARERIRRGEGTRLEDFPW